MNSLNTCKQAPHGGLAAWFRLVIAQASTRISGPCSATARTTADRSAQMVKPYDAFSTLAPGNHGSVLQQQCGAHAKFGVGRVGMVSRIRRLGGQLPQQLRGKSTLTCLHRPLSLMAAGGRRNPDVFFPESAGSRRVPKLFPSEHVKDRPMCTPWKPRSNPTSPSSYP